MRKPAILPPATPQIHRPDMQRVMVMGCSGSGKSTFARGLALRLGVPVHHLDAHFWAPGWVMRDSAEFEARITTLTADNGWVIDGNYSKMSGGRFETADTLVFLDLPLRVCLYRVLKRSLLNYGRERGDTGPGNRERLNWAFLMWVWNWPKNNRPNILAHEAAYPHIRFIRLTSQRDVRQWLANL